MISIRFHNGFSGTAATGFAAGVEAATLFFEWLALEATPDAMTATGYTAGFVQAGSQIDFTVAGSALSYGTGSGYNSSNLIPYTGQIDQVEVRLDGVLILTIGNMAMDAADFAHAQLNWSPTPGALGQYWTDSLLDLLHGPAAQPGNFLVTSGRGLDVQLSSAQNIEARSYDLNLDYHPSILSGHYHMPGADLITGSVGNDTVDSGFGPDTIFGGGGNDRLYAGSAEGLVTGQLDGNIAYGGAGDDEIYSMGTASLAYGGAGNDLIHANSAYGGVGNDTLLVGSVFYSDAITLTTIGVDSHLHGDSGDDVLFGFVGSGSSLLTVHLYGGTGNDTIYGDLAGSGAQQGDWITALDDGDDLIFGGQGNDLVWGGYGNDWIEGEAGNDVLYGDAFYPGFDPSDFFYGLFLEPAGGNDTIYGGGGNDTIDGMGGADRLFGGVGRDVIRGGDGRDRVFGGADNDRLWGDDGNDALDGGDGDDTVFGGAGADVLIGGAGNDVLRAAGGRDTIFGGDGDDTIYSGRERDEITGGAGADVFVFTSLADMGLGAGADWIMDFDNNGMDRIDLSFLSSYQGQPKTVGVTQNGFGSGFDIEIALFERYFLGDPVLLQVDVNDDGIADAELWVVIDSQSAQDNLRAADLIL
jgi:Ca2+-binding RTX toxin-like protein